MVKRMAPAASENDVVLMDGWFMISLTQPPNMSICSAMTGQDAQPRGPEALCRLPDTILFSPSGSTNDSLLTKWLAFGHVRGYRVQPRISHCLQLASHTRTPTILCSGLKAISDDSASRFPHTVTQYVGNGG